MVYQSRHNTHDVKIVSLDVSVLFNIFKSAILPSAKDAMQGYDELKIMKYF